MNIKIGIGFDVHKLVENRKLLLCGVEFDYPLGLLGHSDADVALHAVADAVLGAAGAGDIGQWFPDNDPAFKDADSGKLLQFIMASNELANYRIGNVDMVIICQQPKILPQVPAMKENLAKLLNCTAEQISIKGKTTEKLGYTGRGEGIAAQAVVLLEKV
ncbi:MAG: 2-C-methyl-D-erythritol 2,4-cyclodiphosphate synthase [Lentisphaeria bacterium]|nr:2-C-methyl-D-erythritol 2,4-cyclodiphosphate synthase [Lentisphaerota bacterium]MBR7146008.1 2-C-methyl-D-erythritol 2,4-cyclodiphosphate synthase [Lentisphaeria bacterium]